jgi:hypothetical protein
LFVGGLDGEDQAASHGRIGYKLAAGTLREQSLLLSF